MTYRFIATVALGLVPVPLCAACVSAAGAADGGHSRPASLPGRG